MTVDLSAGNVKLDLVDGTLFRTSGNLTLVSGVADAEPLGIANLALTGNTQNNTLWDNRGDNTIDAGDGDDLVYDRGGHDHINLGDGNDTMMVGGGLDTIAGGNGIDNISYFNSTSGVNVDLFFNIVSGGWAAGDTISGFERVYGSNVSNDILKYTNGDNFLRGYGGNDLLEGRAGNDYLEGGAGADTLIGGSGADFFIFRDGFGVDDVNDFSLADNDRLLLDDSLWIGTLSASEIVSTFASVVGGDVVFDFGGGAALTLIGVVDTAGLDAQISII